MEVVASNHYTNVMVVATSINFLWSQCVLIRGLSANTEKRLHNTNIILRFHHPHPSYSSVRRLCGVVPRLHHSDRQSSNERAQSWFLVPSLARDP